ncbi:MAG TPA: hypothetical protein VKD65_13165, partial [Candidatus Angelobacter sp.]|nr:hypothetical protein [Candidatus Angelobacter sp.]
MKVFDFAFRSIDFLRVSVLQARRGGPPWWIWLLLLLSNLLPSAPSAASVVKDFDFAVRLIDFLRVSVPPWWI